MMWEVYSSATFPIPGIKPSVESFFQGRMGSGRWRYIVKGKNQS
jgi:hypothetical protein